MSPRASPSTAPTRSPAPSVSSESRATLDPEIYPRLERARPVRKVSEGHKRLLETARRLPVRRALRREPAGFSQVAYGLVPHFALKCVVGKPFDVFSNPSAGIGLDGGNDARV